MGAFRLYKAASPFNVSELPEIDAEQSFDVMYMAHLNHDPVRLSRSGHTNWAFGTVAFGPTAEPPADVAVVATHPNEDADNDGNAYFPQPDAYVVTSISKETGQESRPSDRVTATNDLTLKRNFNTVSWTLDPDAARYRVYKAHNDGDLGFIGSTEKASFVDDNYLTDAVGPPTGRDPFAEAGDKPSTVAFFEGRLWWARTLNNPNAVFSSRSADYENMDVSVPLRADDAISLRLVAQGVNQVNQLVPLNNLLAFTSDGLFKIEGSKEDYLTATPPPRQRRQGGTGASRLSPLVVPDSVALYNTKSGEQVRAVGYKFEQDGYSSNDLTIFSPDFFEGFRIVSWCFAEEPLGMVWAARSDGALLAFVWQREQDVWGWTICPLAGGGKVRSLCSIYESGEHRVYAIMERTIAGQLRYTRERLGSAKWRGLQNECHLDCSVSRYFDAPTRVIDGLWHLEGETVAVFADGLVFDVDQGLVVAGGKVSLPEGYTCLVAHAGLPYDAIVETLPLNVQTSLGPGQGRKQQTGTAVVKLTRSRGVLVGVKEEKLRPIKSATGAAPLTSEAPLLSGEFPINTDPVVRLQSTLFIKQRIAPMTVTAVYIDVEASKD